MNNVLTEVIELDPPEIEYIEGILSLCCGAPVTESGFCTVCGDHAI